MREHARVRAADLRYHLFDRSVHPELYEVLRRAELEEKAYRAVLSITGQSHVISVRSGGETVTEILAPPEVSLPRIGLRSSVQLGRTSREEVTRMDGPIHYRTAFRVETFPPAAYRDMQQVLLSAEAFQRIKLFFDTGETPAPGVPLDPSRDFTPFALIDFRHKPRRLDVLSVHASPADLTIVTVDSRFEIVA